MNVKIEIKTELRLYKAIKSLQLNLESKKSIFLLVYNEHSTSEGSSFMMA